MNSFRYSTKSIIFYLSVGIILFIFGAGLLAVTVMTVVDMNKYTPHNHYHSRGNTGSISGWLIAIGLGLCYFGISNFRTVIKHRSTKYVVSEKGLYCYESGNELFIPFDVLGISETELSAVISDRRTKNMITVTNDLDDFKQFVRLLKRKGKG
ncbi:MAG: hypothetical protein ABRQ39_03085 [Candidatus Eremiobacterota bacterium]